MHINPDHFLSTVAGRVVTPERNLDAWRLSYLAFRQALEQANHLAEVYVLIGAQGSGKSTWAKSFHQAQPNAIIFDAILVKAEERLPIISAAQARGIPVIAVFVDTPLSVCLARNTKRPEDEVVSEQALKNVFSAIECPELSEGFSQILYVDL